MTLPVSTLEPLILADGTQIDPSTGKVQKDRKFVEIPSALEAQQIVAKTRRSIAELPLPPSQMTGVSAVLFYTLWGLADKDIAVACGLSIQQIKNIKQLPEYQSIAVDIRKSVLESEADSVRSIFERHAHNAAQKIIDIADEDDGVLGFKASQDILDRAGHRPADVVHHKHTMEQSLRIEYTEKTTPTNIPTIDADYKVITNGNC